MRKFRLHIAMSLDGYAGAPDGGFEWIVYNDQLEKHAHGLTANADAVVFGPATYKGMQSYWTTVPGNPASAEAERRHAAWLEKSQKIVVSSSLPEAAVDWPNSLLLRDAAEIGKIMAGPGGDMVSFGSPGLVRSLVRLGLFTELHINLEPLLLGGGTPLFTPQERQLITLLDARKMDGGVVSLCYGPAGR